MDFQFSEEHTLIQNMVRDFVEQHISPIAAEIDEQHRFPAESILPMGEHGLFGFALPEEFGGTGSDTLSYVLATKEVAKVSAAHAMIMGAQCTLTTPILLNYCNDKSLVERLVPQMISGEKLACFCLTEPGAGCDASAQQTTAVRQGDTYVINGSKVFITNAPQSDVFIVFAMTDKSKGVKGISAFVMEKGTPGLATGAPESKMGINASHTTEVFFSDCVVPASHLLGQEGMGFQIAMKTLDSGRIGVASMALGIAEGALESTIKYVKERVQFGKPLAVNQGLQWTIVDMATRLETAKLLTYQAASFKDSGQPYSYQSAMAKMYATDAAMYITERAVQLHGGMGYTKTYPVERLMREAKVTQIFEGTNEIQRIVMSKYLLG